MAISKRVLLTAINSGKISISPMNQSQVTDNGYILKAGTKIAKFGDNGEAYLNTADRSQNRIEYDIPENGVILEPRRIYELTLKETINSEDYSTQVVPHKSLATYGITLNVSGNIDYNPPGQMKITLTSTQPVTIYPNQDIAVAYFSSAEGDGVPSGAIIMWYGGQIPSGWVECDGRPGTPDLRGRFPLASGAGYSTGQTGGQSSVTLDISQIPSHSHTSGTLYTDVNIPDPTPEPSLMSLDNESDGGSGGNLRVAVHSSVYGSTGSTGGSGSHTNMPPYYVLTFIMKL